MDEDPRAAGPQLGGALPNGADSERSPEAIRADIEQAREEVGDTVEALAAKTDVKAQARERVEEIKGNVRSKADEVKAKPRSPPPDSARQGDQQAVAKVRENPAPFVLGAAVLVAFLIGRRTARP